MDLQKFLWELRKSPRRWEIVRWPDACHAIRLDVHLCPLTFVYNRIAKRLYGETIECGIGDWDLAADGLGFDSELAEQIQCASDFSMKNLDAATKKMRTQLLKATGLSGRHRK